MSEKTEGKFFDLHVEGIGYLNRVRRVQPRRGPEFLACTIAALRGAADQVEYTKFDCRVSGAEAIRIVRLLEAEVSADKQVIVGFRVSDPYPEAFTYEKGERKGTQGLNIKGRLLKVRFVKVDGQTIPIEGSESGRQSSN
jgi:hypothetical protein